MQSARTCGQVMCCGSASAAKEESVLLQLSAGILGEAFSLSQLEACFSLFLLISLIDSD